MKPREDGEGVAMNKTSENLPSPKTTPDEPERDEVRGFIANLRERAKQAHKETDKYLSYPSDSKMMEHAADLLHAAEKRAEEAERERERWLIAAIGSLAKIGVPTPANARQDFGPEMLSSEIAMLGFKRDSARAALGKVVEALKPFADFARHYDDPPGVLTGDSCELWQLGNVRVALTVGQVRKARSALKDAGK